MKENKEGQKEFENLCSEIYRTIQEGNSRPSFGKLEDKLAWLILEQRYHNLSEFIQRQYEKYGSVNSKELLELWFLYNDLKEIHFIGTDLYANALFVMHKVPYLYRSVGKDGEPHVLQEKVKPNEMGKRIFKKCLEQLTSGSRGKLYSYSKCFGTVLYKYANILDSSTEKGTVIEIRKDSYVNAISEDGYHTIKSLQKYIRETKTDVGETETKIEIPFFTVDMSNARGNSVKNIMHWLDDFLGKQKYGKDNQLHDPIGDAEVVSNFTSDDSQQGEYILCSNVERFPLNITEFCVLLYRYFSKYAQEDFTKQYHNMEHCEEKTARGMKRFEDSIQKTLSNLQDSGYGNYKEFYEIILNQSISADNSKLQTIMENIDWEREIVYMNRVKTEKEGADKIRAQMEMYKGGDSVLLSKIWKYILFAAKKGNSLNFSEQAQICFFWEHTPSKDGQITENCLSQWWKCTFVENNIPFCSSEQYMMYHKALLFEDYESAQRIITSSEPEKSQKLGRDVRGFDPKIWNEHKREIVLQGNLLKFSQNSDLKHFLLGTGDKILAEANPKDKIWGIGMSRDSEGIWDPANWKGDNLLGEILMETRERIREDETDR